MLATKVASHLARIAVRWQLPFKKTPGRTAPGSSALKPDLCPEVDRKFLPAKLPSTSLPPPRVLPSPPGAPVKAAA